MIWFCVLGYVLVSQLAMCTLLQTFIVDKDDSENDWLACLDPQQKRRLILLSWIASIVAGPIVLPLMLLDCLFGAASDARRAEVKFWAGFKRRYRPLVLDPVHRYNMDEHLWEHLESEQAAFDAFDFQVLGEFVLKDEPLKIEARVLLHPEGQCIAEIGQVADSFYIELTSFLEDGGVVCTSNGTELEIREQLSCEQYHCFACPDADALELIEQHRMNLDQYLATHEEPIRLVPERHWKAYFRYSNQRFGEILHRLGEHDNGPDCVDFPSAYEDDTSNSVHHIEQCVSKTDDTQHALRVFRDPVDS